MFSMRWSTSVTVVQRLQIHIDIILERALNFRDPDSFAKRRHHNHILILRGRMKEQQNDTFYLNVDRAVGLILLL